jgi:hypothetical protein
MHAHEHRPTSFPALGYHWLTRFYDPLVALTLRERRSNSSWWIRRACGPATRARLRLRHRHLALLLKRACPEARVGRRRCRSHRARLARRKIEDAGLAIELHQGFLTAETFPPASFDRVVSTLVLHHLTHDEKLATRGRAARACCARAASCTWPISAPRALRTRAW